MTTYPDLCLQALAVTDWWVEQDNTSVTRGSLIWAVIPHIDQIPYGFEPVGRKESDQHTEALVKVAPLAVGQPLKQTDLPVAAMTVNKGEIFAAYRAKTRPCLVLAGPGTTIDKELTRGKPNRNTAGTYLVAPYYGADPGGKRAGYNPKFVNLVQRCEYPQFVYDKLPLKGPSESILRLDQMQPIGAHSKALNTTGFSLHPDALRLIDEHVHWLIHGELPTDGSVLEYRQVAAEL